MDPRLATVAMGGRGIPLSSHWKPYAWAGIPVDRGRPRLPNLHADDLEKAELRILVRPRGPRIHSLVTDCGCPMNGLDEAASVGWP